MTLQYFDANGKSRWILHYVSQRVLGVSWYSLEKIVLTK